LKHKLKDCWGKEVIEFDDEENSITALEDCRVSLSGNIISKEIKGKVKKYETP